MHKMPSSPYDTSSSNTQIAARRVRLRTNIATLKVASASWSKGERERPPAQNHREPSPKHSNAQQVLLVNVANYSRLQRYDEADSYRMAICETSASVVNTYIKFLAVD